ncbi:tripartite motif-containing protein 16-like protein isoform X2 [Nerophis ophidion]|uniref:tripartite motif-containing protein 16-like protein isoform X2 n=1 Tax=Nerophis ophidion TaxID=159077 RepID=UPI002AE035A8|nr:tripartite motif-containing protein 16-like protein isoform X2 [Nerophis ophidion]
MYVNVKWLRCPFYPLWRSCSTDLNVCLRHPLGGIKARSNSATVHLHFASTRTSLMLLNADTSFKMPARPKSAIILHETCKDWINLSLDDKTANKMLWISDNGSKARRRLDEVCPVLDRPERYEYSPQVLSKEGIWNMRAYWEVNYTGWVVIGATYEGAGRRANSGPSGLGENAESWGLGWAGTRYQIWFNGVNKDINHVPYCSTIGVYVDQPAGIISFYVVSGEGADREVKLLYRVKTNIEKKIIPGFWMGIQSSCTLLKKAE